jgi:hypothetical protein
LAVDIWKVDVGPGRPQLPSGAVKLEQHGLIGVQRTSRLWPLIIGDPVAEK